MTELQTEDGLALGSIGPELINHVVEEIVDAMVEGEVVRHVILVSEHFLLELFN